MWPRPTGKPADAVATFAKLTEDYPELPEFYNNLAVLYANQNQLDKACTALEMAIRTNPSYATAHETWATFTPSWPARPGNKALQLDAANANRSSPSWPDPRIVLPADIAKGAKPAAQRAPGRGATQVGPHPPAPAGPCPHTGPRRHSGCAGCQCHQPRHPLRQTQPSKKPRRMPRSHRSREARAAAWAAKDMKAYLAAYGKDFDPPGRMTRAAWEKNVNPDRGQTKITVQVSDLNVSVNGNKATARFRQAYSADSLNVSSRKTLDLVESNGRWLIVREATGG